MITPEGRRRQWFIILACACAFAGGLFGVWGWVVFCLAGGLRAATWRKGAFETHNPTTPDTARLHH